MEAINRICELNTFMDYILLGLLFIVVFHVLIIGAWLLDKIFKVDE